MRAPYVPRPPIRPIVRAASILALTALLGMLAASPAVAARHDVATASVKWQFVDDVTGTIGDAAAHDHPGALSGWTSDAFDTFGQLRITEPTSGQYWDFAANSSTSTVIDGDTAEWVLTGSPVWAGFTYTVTLTLTLQGNSARWAYTITGGAVASVPPEPVVVGAQPHIGSTVVDTGLTVDFRGELGSDEATRYTVNGTSLMSDDGGGTAAATDPVLGYAVTTDGAFTGWAAVPGTDVPHATATGVTSFMVDVVYADYNSCGFAAAQSLVSSLLPNLPSRFGEVHPTTGDCLAFDPVTLEVGAPVDQVLTFEIDPLLSSGGFFGDQIDVVVAELPAGLDYTAEQDPIDRSIVIQLWGTPTQLGDFTASTVFSVPGATQNQRAATALPGSKPVYGSIAFRIVPSTAVVVVPPDVVVVPPDVVVVPPDTTPPVTTPPVTTPPVTTPIVDPTPLGGPSGSPTVTPAVTPAVTRAVTPTVSLVTALPSIAQETAGEASALQALQALPTTGIDPARGLGFGVLAILGGALALTALALRSDTRGARP